MTRVCGDTNKVRKESGINIGRINQSPGGSALSLVPRYMDDGWDTGFGSNILSNQELIR